MKSKKALLIAIYGILPALVVWMSATATEQSLVLISGTLACAVIGVMASILAALTLIQRQRVWSVLVASLISMVAIASVIATNWPLRVAYALSRPSFDKFALEIRAGQQWTKPQWIGLIRVKKAEVYRNGIVCLWTDLNPSGNTGFVQCQPSHVPFNLWSVVKLDDGWQFISED